MLIIRQDLRPDKQFLRTLHGRDGADQDSRTGKKEAHALARVLQAKVQQDEVWKYICRKVSPIYAQYAPFRRLLDLEHEELLAQAKLEDEKHEMR